MDRKTNINNLNIVWQGQSWSVIAPDGQVIRRFKEKYEAIQFAQNTSEYVEKESSNTNYTGQNPKRSKQVKVDRVFTFDGELDIDDEVSAHDSDIPLHKRKHSNSYTLTQKLKPHRSVIFVVASILFGGIPLLFIAKAVAPLVIAATSNVFYAFCTLPFLVTGAILIPMSLHSLENSYQYGTFQSLLCWPLLILGATGLAIGIVFGVIYCMESLVSTGMPFAQILLTFVLWIWISFCLLFYGKHWKREAF
jgi:hypothetical protein